MASPEQRIIDALLEIMDDTSSSWHEMQMATLEALSVIGADVARENAQAGAQANQGQGSQYQPQYQPQYHQQFHLPQLPHQPQLQLPQLPQQPPARHPLPASAPHPLPAIASAPARARGHDEDGNDLRNFLCPFPGCNRRFQHKTSRTRHYKINHPGLPVPPENDA
ncbi:hypothetical protein EsH8_III_000353 [Colletotrichum jinshuiense]